MAAKYTYNVMNTDLSIVSFYKDTTKSRGKTIQPDNRKCSDSNEMDVLTIHNALLYACSQDPHELKLGEKQLTSWEKEKGYYGGLAVSE